LAIGRNPYTGTSETEAQGAEYSVVNLREYFGSEVLEIFPEHAPQAIVAHLVNFILANLGFNILLELVCIRGSNVNSKSPFVNQGFHVFFRLSSRSRHLEGFEGKGRVFGGR
jgi:hypothetical protein